MKGCKAEEWYPAYVVNATEDSHVRAGVRFAGQHNIRLNVKHTGHNTNSQGPGSLSIWTHHVKGMEFAQHWTSTGCATAANASRMAMVFGAGVQDREAFEAAANHDAVVVGGTDSTVGLVGWLAGGGHGYLTGTYGMGADNVLEARVVLPTGDVVVADECQRTDLFWAIRGGGPSFGVLTSLTMKAYPMPNTTLWSVTLTAKNGTTDLQWCEAVAGFHSHLPASKQAGLQGYVTISGPPMTLTSAMFAYNTSNSSLSSATRTLSSYLQSQSAVISTSSTFMSVPGWIDVYHMFNLTLSAGGGAGAVTSRLLPAKALTEDMDFLTKVLQTVGPSSEGANGNISQNSISGSFVASSRPVDNALNPAWRDAVVHFRVSNSWDMNVNDTEAEEATLQMTESIGRALRQLAPDSGAYFNEADANEPNWQWSLFGPNYPRLLALKNKYDPEGLMWCHHCVGSEYWKAGDDGQLCRRW